MPGKYTITGWTASLDIDPFVSNNVTVTNTSGVTQTSVATVLLAIPAFAYGTVIKRLCPSPQPSRCSARGSSGCSPSAAAA